MLAAEHLAEKSFELWPGALRLAASGEGAEAALDAGLAAARNLASSLAADAELIGKMGAAGSLDMLPRGAAGRLVSEAARALIQGVAKAGEMPPPLVALPGAVCDHVLAAMHEAGAFETIVVSLGDAVAFDVRDGAAPPAEGPVSAVLGEFLRALGPGQRGGVALAGFGGAFPTSGAADRVAVHAKNAALAALTAAFIADGTTAPALRREAGPSSPEAIQDGLAAGMKRARSLREKRLMRAGALALKGRGRTLGPIDGDRLLRFGVSEWR